MPNLLQAPADKRDDLVQSNLIQPTSEMRPTTAKGREQETWAAFAAAYLGSMLSKDDNVVFGAQWLDVTPDHHAAPAPAATGSGSAAPPPPAPVDADDLVPWVHLK